MRNSTAVRIRKDQPEDWLSWLNRIIEIGFFAKSEVTGYFNNVKANLRLISAGYTAAVVSIVGFILYSQLSRLCVADWPTNADETIATITFAFLTFWTGLFWNEKVNIHKKWEYLAALYNEVLKTDPQKISGRQTRDLLENALALDVLQLEMWSHESYSDFFLHALDDAIRATRSPTEADFACKGLMAKGLLASEAKEYLLAYQQALFSRQSNVA